MQSEDLWKAFLADKSVENRNALVEAYLPMARKVARKSSRSAADFDEVFSVVVEAMITAIPKSKSMDSTYLYKKMNWAALHMYRKPRVKTVELVDEKAEIEPMHQCELEDWLSVLTPVQAVVLRERVLNGRTLRDVAGDIGLHASTVAHHERVALEKLR